MNAMDGMAGFEALDPEWDRIEALALCLVETRQGREPPEGLLTALQSLQAAVVDLRQGTSQWHGLPLDGLGMLEMDILSALAAVEVQPRVGWLFQTLQNSGPHASPALLQELLALQGRDVAAMHHALSPEGVLTERRLVSVEAPGLYGAVRMEPRMLALLMGWRSVGAPPPGATLIRDVATWDDLVLPETQIQMLCEFLYWVRERPRVVGDWGGRDVGGPLALFSGPSGTGKTFTASVLAADLGWPLYRVDLGMIVSKYIGETEKNLNALFDAAHGQEMVLQFDEADSLLGKRAEVKEARDRYANMEVSHLLSRIEQHRGPCILTTNLRTHLDTAFMRRFQAVIEFPRPDVPARQALWARLLPRGAPLSDEIDLEALARAVPLTGGGIQNAALHAAYLASAAGCDIGLPQIATAIWREMGKSGKPLGRREMGPLADHLPDIALAEGAA
ncbi:MAG: ATP-binding protein [Pseudomonadota bacterium]